MKIFVFRDDDEPLFECVQPDEGVGRTSEPDVSDVGTVGKKIGELRGQFGRKIFVEEQLHAAWPR